MRTPTPDPVPAGAARVFLAGATGVIGRRLPPLLVAAGHPVTAMTRRPDRTAALRAPATTTRTRNFWMARHMARPYAPNNSRAMMSLRISWVPAPMWLSLAVR